MPVACLALFGLGLRYALFLPAARACGFSAWTATGNFFSFFTVHANLALALVLLVPGRLRRPWALGGATLTLGLVGLIYETLLRGVWNPGGGEFLASLILHDLVPLAALALWFRRPERGALRWRHAFLWLIFPAAYLLYLVFRGLATGWWIYPFLDVQALGAARVALTASALLGLHLLGGLALVAWDRRSLAPQEEAPEIFELEEEPLMDPSGA
ncbi:MAG TPA: Pr6Pr family membrane protein [Holophagaceae bacterium]|nr:Pr6Pr family membrane protein [Holophagaceae bacterium]